MAAKFIAAALGFCIIKSQWLGVSALRYAVGGTNTIKHLSCPLLWSLASVYDCLYSYMCISESCSHATPLCQTLMFCCSHVDFIQTHKELLWNRGLIHLQYEPNKELQNEKNLLRPKKKKKCIISLAVSVLIIKLWPKLWQLHSNQFILEFK